MKLRRTLLSSALLALSAGVNANHPGDIGYGKPLDSLTEAEMKSLTVESSSHGGPHIPAATVVIFKDGSYVVKKCFNCVEYNQFPPPLGSAHENAVIEKDNYYPSLIKYVDAPGSDPCIFSEVKGTMRLICW